MRIIRIQEGSPAECAGMRGGDRLLAIDGHAIREHLDYQFHASGEEMRAAIGRDTETATREIELTRSQGEAWGIELAEDPIRCCGNHCVFCFIDQNPQGLRRSLYVKDEDYRLSLTYGNYVTLTNLEAWEIDRIIEMRLSPLYVSIHAVDPAVRRRLLRSRDTDDVRPILRLLCDAGIRLHVQIVVVPDYNDGDVLEETLSELEALAPAVQTIAVVPVGLTRHRARLTPLRLLGREESRQVARCIEIHQEACLVRLGTRLVFAADELYLRAELPLPPAEAYEGYPQLENGVGMVRAFEERLAEAGPILPAAGGDRRVVLVTGTLFAPFLEAAMAGTFDVRVLPVQNRLFGPTVTVAGLLGGREIIHSLREAGGFDLAVLPPEVLGAEDRLLDDVTPREIAEAIGRPVEVGFGEGSR